MWCSERNGGAASEIVGAIDPDNITHTVSTSLTHIPIEFTKASTANAPIGDYTYDVQLTLTDTAASDGTKIKSEAELQQDEA